MPKIRSHSGAKKRFRLTASGKVKYKKTRRSHLLAKKRPKRMLHLRKGGFLNKTQASIIKQIIPYS